MEHIYSCTGHELKIPNIIDSRGAYVFDDEGTRYMDPESGVWCVPVGHKNDRVNRVIKDRIDPPLILEESEFDGFIDAFAAMLH